MSMWLKVTIPHESDSSLLFEELGIPHDADDEKTDVLIHINNLLSIASRKGEEEECWVCASDQQALPMYAHIDEVHNRIKEMTSLAHKRKVKFPYFVRLSALMPQNAEEAELPNPELYEHHILLNVDQIFHISSPGSHPCLVSVGFGAPSLHYELTPQSGAYLHQILGMTT